MNASFYLAISRLPLATVGAIEFLGPIGLAAVGFRSQRNLLALALAIAGVYLLTQLRFQGEALGYLFAFLNCALFVLYIVLGHRIAAEGGAEGIDRLGAAMLVAAIAAAPLGLADALPAFRDPALLAAGIAVGLCSSVIPYVCDQLAMARLPRATFALMLALLPATACIIGLLVLHQAPTARDRAGLGLVIAGVALHRQGRDLAVVAASVVERKPPKVMPGSGTIDVEIGSARVRLRGPVDDAGLRSVLTALRSLA